MERTESTISDMKRQKAKSCTAASKKKITKGKKKPAFKDDIKKVAKLAKDIVGEVIAKKRNIKAADTSYKDDEVTQQEAGTAKKTKSKAQGEAQIQFFYTNDKYFTQFDDQEIVKAVQQKYPDFMREGISDGDLKKTIVTILQDTAYVASVLDFFNMNIQDFFKFIFRRETSIFKGPYLTKLQRTLRENGYDI